LAIGRNGIGLELARPARLACLTVTELTTTLAGVRFPVDVSGGVPRFRHRRGDLQRLQLELPARALEAWAAPRLRGLVGTRTPDVSVVMESGKAAATVCVAASRPPEEETSRLPPALAFTVHAIADGDDLVLVVDRARGSELPAPATAIAIACVRALLGEEIERRGAVFVVRCAAEAIARALFPEAGARVPATEGVVWAAMAARGDAWFLHAARGALAAAPDEEALAARETALAVCEADDALVREDLAGARARYVEALERAPRQARIVRRVAEIDARAGGRTESALAMLAEAHGDDARIGTMPGELLAEKGDTNAAIASLERTGNDDDAPAIAARAFEIAARLSRDAEQAAAWLDRALARAPRSAAARWARVAKRLELGRLEDALADVEHLEALARGPRARYAVWARAGRAWQAAGLGTRARPIFERALRYAPDEPGALAGLGSALLAEGADARGIAVLTDALKLAEARGDAVLQSRTTLDLGRALAERLDDPPAAIARLSTIPATAYEAPAARGLEGRWRGRLGDLSGASLAFARLREFAASLPAGTDDPRSPAIASLLLEAAEFERTALRDPLAAQRHLAAALRLRPHDPELRTAYREVGVLVALGAEPLRERSDDAAAPPAALAPLSPAPAALAPLSPAPAALAPPAPAPAALAPLSPAPTALAPLSPAPAPGPASPPADSQAVDLALDETEASARVEELTRRLQGNPADSAAADELSVLLERLGRGHELLALLAARMEDADPAQRAALAPRARATLARLAAEAEAADRHDEATLYRQVADTLTA
jgi:tetratricopeptide (TPR) repeat protein